MQTAIVDTRLLGVLALFYNAACTIMEYTTVADTYGAPVRTWANKASHVNIACRIAPKSAGSEVKLPSQTYSSSQQTITLSGNYPLIVMQMRAAVGGVNYDILGARVDGFNVSTVLDVQIVPGSVVS